MFIYILNLLNDESKKNNNIYERSAYEIINDTKYISQLAGIKENYDFYEMKNKIVDVFNIMDKYNLSDNKKLQIVDKLLKNIEYIWVAQNLNNYYNCDDSKLNLSLILNNAIENKETKELEKNKDLLSCTCKVDVMKEYYFKFFNCKLGKKHFNKKEGVASYSIKPTSRVKLKVISNEDTNSKNVLKELGHKHAKILISVGSKERVHELTERIRKAGYAIAKRVKNINNEYCESFVLDPEGNCIQITI